MMDNADGFMDDVVDHLQRGAPGMVLQPQRQMAPLQLPLQMPQMQMPLQMPQMQMQMPMQMQMQMQMPQNNVMSHMMPHMMPHMMQPMAPMNNPMVHIVTVVNEAPIMPAEAGGGGGGGGSATTGRASRRGIKLGARRQISEDQRREMARLINTDKRSVSSVATEFNVAYKTAYRIAAGARGDPKFAPIRDMTTPKIQVAMPDPPAIFATDEPIKLRGRKLTDEEKSYLAALVNIKRMSAAKVAAKYDVPKSSVIGYASAAMNGRATGAAKRGALPIIDPESDRALRALALLQGEHRVSREDMERHIAAESIKTQERRAARKLNISKAKSGGAGAGAQPVDGGLTAEAEEMAPMHDEGGQAIKRVCHQTLAKYLASYGF